MSVFLKFNQNNKVINQGNPAHTVDQGWFDATGRSDGPDYMGRTYDEATDTFSPRIVPPQTRREELKVKTTWTPQDRTDAIRELL